MWYVTVPWHRYLHTNDRQELEHDLITMTNMLIVSMNAYTAWHLF